MPSVDRLHDVRLVRPQRDPAAVPRQQVGEGGSPRTGAYHGGAHHPGGVFLPNRGSSPRLRRAMFDRWVQKTNAATTALTTNSGERTPSRHPMITGRTTAALNEPRET